MPVVIIKITDYSIINITIKTTYDGRRRGGRARVSWRRSAEREREEMGWKSWADATAAAKDREGWKAILNGLQRPPGRS